VPASAGGLAALCFPPHDAEVLMRRFLNAALAAAMLTGLALAEEPAKMAPKVVLPAPDGKETYDLAKLAADGPVLVRLTCACSGCDQELPFFQKLQTAYEGKGLKTLAAFQDKPDAVSAYVVKKDVRFLWVADPKGDLWKTFDTKTMPTNILIEKGGRIVKVLSGCTKDGKNAQALSGEIAKLLQTKEVVVTELKAEPKK
jgi:peroxiredoxin